MTDHGGLPVQRVFISHQWTDKAVAHRLRDELKAVADVWIDIHDIELGGSISGQIEQALSEVDALILLWTSNSAASRSVHKELEAARRLGLPIIPVFLERDAAGNPTPPVPEYLRDTLGVEVEHHGMLASKIMAHLQRQMFGGLPESVRMEMESSERAFVIKELAAAISGLDHCNRTGTGDREYWVQAISDLMTRHVANAGADEVEAFRQAIERLPAGNADFDIVRQAFRSATESWSGTGRAERQAAGHADPLDALLGSFLPSSRAEAAKTLLQDYVQSSGPVLAALNDLALATHSMAGRNVVQGLAQYLQTEHDLIPDHFGTLGLLDDAWLIHNTAFRLVEAQLIPGDAIPVNLDAVIQADALVRQILPPQILASLTTILMSFLHQIALEVGPVAQMRPGDQASSGGRTFEDIANDFSARHGGQLPPM